MLEQKFGMAVSVMVMNEFRQERDLGRRQGSWQESGASEMLIALALANGVLDTLTDAIYQHVQRQRASERFQESRSMPRDHPELRDNGRFTSAYTTSSDVRKVRFQSLEETPGRNAWSPWGYFRVPGLRCTELARIHEKKTMYHVGVE
ncbi:MAG: hypothetical protein GY801_45450 [bacterium]|nr:hypothetical protein [bacterium]